MAPYNASRAPLHHPADCRHRFAFGRDGPDWRLHSRDYEVPVNHRNCGKQRLPGRLLRIKPTQKSGLGHTFCVVKFHILQLLSGGLSMMLTVGGDPNAQHLSDDSGWPNC